MAAAGIDLAFGVFGVMTIIAGLFLATLAARFVYIDRQYTEMIRGNAEKEDNLRAAMQEGGREGESRQEQSDMLDHLLANKEAMATYRSRRKGNRFLGAILDLFTVLMVILIGMLTTILSPDVALVCAVLVILMIPALVHFIVHIRWLQRERSI